MAPSRARWGLDQSHASEYHEYSSLVVTAVPATECGDSVASSVARASETLGLRGGGGGRGLAFTASCALIGPT
eukprot:7393295-Pyramimonas_sp.AAC.1